MVVVDWWWWYSLWFRSCCIQANCGGGFGDRHCGGGFNFGAPCNLWWFWLWCMQCRQTVVILVLVLVHVSKLWWWWLWFWLWCTYAQPAAGERHEFGGRSASHRSGGHSGFLIRGGSLYSHPRQQANLSITKPRAIMCI